MAKLVGASATVEIQPQRRESQSSHWIDTEISLEYHIQEQCVRFQLPSTAVSLNAEDFRRLVEGATAYIKTLPIRPITSRELVLESFHFMPIEPSIEFMASSGSFFDESCTDGEIFIDFKMGLRAIGIESVAGDQIGCVIRVQIVDLLLFLDQLKYEVTTILA